jgi:tetratricopeptide (TPR) repeat protein
MARHILYNISESLQKIISLNIFEGDFVNEAQTLFRDAVLLIRNGTDNEQARKMLMESLRLNPQNEMGWLWLARTLEQPRQQMDCIERALKINPENEQALAMREELLKDLVNPKKKTTTQTNIMPLSSTTTSTVPVVKTSTSTVPAVTTPASTTSTSTMSTVPQPAPKKKTQTLSTAPVPPPIPGLEGDVPELKRTTTTQVAARQRRQLSLTERRRIDAMLDKANKLVEGGDLEAAIEQWVKVLQVQDDHEEAIRNAVRYLSKLGYMDDAKELVWRAINNGTDHPSIFLTAIEIADREKDNETADELRTSVVKLPQANENVVIMIADYYIRTKHHHRAIEILKDSLASHPKSQKILVRLGDLYQEKNSEREAVMYYDLAAQLGTGTKEGKTADKKMKDYVPVMTDKERGSWLMAWREALGFGAAFLLLAFQDAGLTFARFGLGRWAGVGISIIGGYLLVTATSSPQQRGLGKLLGGDVPYGTDFDGEEHHGVIEKETELPMIPTAARVVLGVIGSVMLVGAFMLVFSTALRLLVDPVSPNLPEFCRVMSWEPYLYSFDELRNLVGCP